MRHNLSSKKKNTAKTVSVCAIVCAIIAIIGILAVKIISERTANDDTLSNILSALR